MKRETFSCTELEIGWSVCVGSLDRIVVQSLRCFVAIRHWLSCHTFHVYFELFQHLKKCRRSRLYGIRSHILVSHFFVTLWHCNISDLWF